MFIGLKAQGKEKVGRRGHELCRMLWSIQSCRMEGRR